MSIREYSGHALTTSNHMHHHQISQMNPSPSEDQIYQESLIIGDLIPVSTPWQESESQHVMKHFTDDYQVVCRWLAHPMGIQQSTYPLNCLSMLKSRNGRPHLRLTYPHSIQQLPLQESGKKKSASSSISSPLKVQEIGSPTRYLALAQTAQTKDENAGLDKNTVGSDPILAKRF